MSSALDPAALLPHGPPARFAEEVLELGLEPGAESIVCRGRVPVGSASVAAGRAGAWVALELAAQAAGLLTVAADPAGAPRPRVGYIVRVRDARWPHPTVPAGEPMIARVTLTGRAGALSLFRARVELAGQEVATATLATFVPAPDAG